MGQLTIDDILTGVAECNVILENAFSSKCNSRILNDINMYTAAKIKQNTKTEKPSEQNNAADKRVVGRVPAVRVVATRRRPVARHQHAPRSRVPAHVLSNVQRPEAHLSM